MSLPIIPDLEVPPPRAAAPAPVWPEIPDLVVPQRLVEEKREPTLPAAGTLGPHGLMVGLTAAEVAELDFGPCPDNGSACACFACTMTASLLCACGCPYIDHAPGPTEGDPIVCGECEACTSFVLASWMGGPPAPPVPAKRVLAPPAPMPVPPPLPAPAPPPARPRRQRRVPHPQPPPAPTKPSPS